MGHAGREQSSTIRIVSLLLAARATRGSQKSIFAFKLENLTTKRLYSNRNATETIRGPCAGAIRVIVTTGELGFCELNCVRLQRDASQISHFRVFL